MAVRGIPNCQRGAELCQFDRKHFGTAKTLPLLIISELLSTLFVRI